MENQNIQQIEIPANPTIPSYFADSVATMGLSSLQNSLEFLSTVFLDYEDMDKSRVEQLGCLLGVLSDYASLINHLQEN